MIKGFEPPHPAEPIAKSRWQPMPAVAAGLIAGVILLIVPHASPWEGLNPFMPAILGRTVPPQWGMSLLGIIVVHLVISFIYGLIISLVVMNIHQLRAVLVGGIAGLVLYLINFGIVSAWLPAIKGNKISVIVTHGVFGLVAAGAYRGLLRRLLPTTSP